MGAALRFRADLYRGTAPYYDRYRPPYPDALFDDLRRRAPLTGTGRVLDLACGTGQIAFPLARHTGSVVAVDQEAQSVAFGRSKADAAGISNITWVTGSAEEVALDGVFDLVTIGNAFQRLDRPVVARRAFSWVRPGGAVALVWSDSPWHGDLPWQHALANLMREWTAKTGASDRVPADWESAIQKDPHERVLRAAGFEYVGKFVFPAEQAWTVDELTGFVYSTSLLNREALGMHAEEFARDLAERLGAYAGAGPLRQVVSYAYDLARR